MSLQPLSLTSLVYFGFLALAMIAYYNLPKRFQSAALLAFSLFFYSLYGVGYCLLLVAVVAVTYLLGRAIFNKLQQNAVKPAAFLCGLGVLVIIALLVCYHSLGFAAGLFNRVSSMVGLGAQLTIPSIVAPVGLSFFTLTCVGYVIDVKRGKYPAETNIVDFALFVSFFPQLLSGPIPRGDSLLPQLKQPKKFEFENGRKGALMLLWGCFVKFVIADNLSLVVSTQYAGWQNQDGIRLLTASVLYGAYIYCDFMSYTFLARGSAKLLGIDLIENFKMPYFSRSVRAFWRRWHISLSSWFRDYLYIPLGGSRKGKLRYWLNNMVVFLVSGLWHGASLNFVFWGFLHGIYVVAGDISDKPRAAIKQKLRIRENGFWERIVRPIITFTMVNFAWIYFGAPSFTAANTIIKSFFSIDWANIPGYLLWSLGVDNHKIIAALAALVLLFVVDLLRTKGPLLPRMFQSVPATLRYAIWYLLLFAIVVFGAFGSSSFIYFQF